MFYKVREDGTVIELEVVGVNYSKRPDATQEQIDDFLIVVNKKVACDLVKDNYNTYCEQGLSYLIYTIENTSKTRDEIDKKIINVTLDIDTDYDWTMDSPREKVVVASKEMCLDFMEAVQCVIASNETLLRDKKTTIKNLDLAEVDAFIASPTYPVYNSTV